SGTQTMTNDHLQRAEVLLSQGRFEMAEGELRAYLAYAPDDPLAHAWLAQALLGLDKAPAEAVAEARTAVHMATYAAYPQMVLSLALEKQDKLLEAEVAAREAIRLDPDEAAYHAQLADLLSRRRRWSEAADAAQRGLEIDAEDLACINLR